MVTSFSNQSKNTASFANGTKHTSAFANIAKSLKVWGDLTFEEVGNYTFESVVLSDGTTVANVTFETLVDIIWSNQQRN